MRKSLIAAAVTTALAMGLSGAAMAEGITVFNSKMEIQSQLEEMAAQYSEETGVDVEVYYSSDTVAAHMSTRYASNEPYTISMVDAKDIYALAADHALDLSDQEWVGNTTQAISIDGKVYGYPVCIEARGIIYNADAIKNATGEDFDPASIKTTEDFQAIIDKCIAGGMAEAMYGVPEYLKQECRKRLEPDMVKVLDRFDRERRGRND